MTEHKTDARIDKRRVTMTNIAYAGKDDKGNDIFQKNEAVDYVRPDFLEAYVAEAKTRWASVEVSEEPDAGPGGYDGETTVPASINHPLAGQTFAATTEED